MKILNILLWVTHAKPKTEQIYEDKGLTSATTNLTREKERNLKISSKNNQVKLMITFILKLSKLLKKPKRNIRPVSSFK